MVRRVPDEFPETRNGARRDPYRIGEPGETVDVPPSPQEMADDFAAADPEPARPQAQSEPAGNHETGGLKKRA